MLDVVIRGGGVLDETATPCFRADVGLTGGHVAEVGSLAGAPGVTEIDATGRYVLPGFIDTHVHADAAVFDQEMHRSAAGSHHAAARAGRAVPRPGEPGHDRLCDPLLRPCQRPASGA